MKRERVTKWTWLALLIAGTTTIASRAQYYPHYQDYPIYFPLTGQTDAHWTSNIPGYYYIKGTNRMMMVWNTNTAPFWQSGDWIERTWVEDTNGWRVQITCYTDAPIGVLTIGIGSATVDSGTNYYWVPDRKFAKFELLNSNGVVVPPRRGASKEGDYPPRVSIRDYPEWEAYPLGYRLIFYSNGPPARVGACNLDQAFRIKSAGDYTLTVCPVVYKPETNGTNFDRVDLPCVTAKVYLDPKSWPLATPKR